MSPSKEAYIINVNMLMLYVQMSWEKMVVDAQELIKMCPK